MTKSEMRRRFGDASGAGQAKEATGLQVRGWELKRGQRLKWSCWMKGVIVLRPLEASMANDTGSARGRTS